MTDEAIEFIKYDFELPCHENELSQAGDIIEKLKARLSDYQKKKSITDKQFVLFYEEIIIALDYVGRLSKPLFKIEDELQEMYLQQYLHAPELGKEIWMKHNNKIHHPYNLLKNRCFKLLDEMDAMYKEFYDKEPPNWRV
jgi:hypothetical protein